MRTMWSDRRPRMGPALAALSCVVLGAAPAAAQTPRPRTPGDTLQSPVVAADRRVTFQLYAPKATAVALRTEGPAPFTDRPLRRNADGVWTLTTDPVEPDLYIYWFDVDGMAAADPANPRPRVNLRTVRSLLDVRGAAAEGIAERAVPHGAVSEVWYRSASLDTARRMHVYTPPGYGTDTTRYPVLYLLHGAGDDDDSWTTVGRANFILDNLVAAGAARPMIVVMPAGHTPRRGGLFGPAPLDDPFVRDFLDDVVPYVERHYRVLPGREHRAIAGLSMGGWHSLLIGLPNLDRFSHIGVFSAGMFGPRGPEQYEERHGAALRDPRLNERLRLFWIATGKEDFVLPATKATLALLDRHGIRYTYRETAGGHTWPNWRAYLTEFLQLLFR